MQSPPFTIPSTVEDGKHIVLSGRSPALPRDRPWLPKHLSRTEYNWTYSLGTFSDTPDPRVSLDLAAVPQI